MMLSRRIIVTLSLLLANITGSSHAFCRPSSLQRTISATTSKSSTQVFADATQQTSVGNSHGQGSCFLPLLQNDEEYIAPRIVQVSYNIKKLVSEKKCATHTHQFLAAFYNNQQQTHEGMRKQSRAAN